jgi:hypothetical protein
MIAKTPPGRNRAKQKVYAEGQASSATGCGSTGIAFHMPMPRNANPEPIGEVFFNFA